MGNGHMGTARQFGQPFLRALFSRLGPALQGLYGRGGGALPQSFLATVF
jgi:hypothetical protein